MNAGARRWPALLAVAVLLVLGTGQPAEAHAFLQRSNPADGATLQRAPTVLTLVFDEPVVMAATHVRLRGGDGVEHEGLRPTPGHDPRLVEVSLPPLQRGTYSVSWQVLAQDDAHRSSGSLVFGVRDRALVGRPSMGGSPPPVRGSLLTWLELAAIALAFGACLVAALVLPQAVPDAGSRARIGRALWRTVAVAAGLAFVCGAGALLDAAGGVGNAGRMLSTPRFGSWWLLRACGLGLLVLVARGASRRLSSAPRRSWQIVAVGAIAMSLAGTSHVDQGHRVSTGAALLAAHLTAGMVWAGSVVVLAALLPLLRREGLAAGPFLTAFRRPAVVCVAVVLTTGMALTGLQTASLDALLTTAYGQLLLLKVALVAGAALLGLRTALALRAGTGHSVSRVRVEAAALVVVLGAAGALSLGEPPRGAAFLQASSDRQSSLAAQVADVFVTLDLAPNAVGDSWMRVSVDQTRRPVIAAVTGVAAVLVSPSGKTLPTQALSRGTGPSAWELRSVPLTETGRWRVRLTVQRGARTDVWPVTWSVPGAPGRATLVSASPWTAALELLAGALGVLAMAAALIASGVRREAPPAPSRFPLSPAVRTP